jgi:RNA polymerase primary sigma factor
MDLLQKWKTLERMHGPLIHWDPKKEVKDEPPRPKPVRVPRPIAVLAEHRPRQKTVVAFVPKPKVDPPPAPVEEEPEDEEPVEPKWKFERTNEPLPDVSGMSKADAQIALAQAFQKGCEAAFRPLIDSVKYLIFKHAKKAAYRARGETGQADIDDATSSIHLHIFKRLYTFDATRAGFVTWVGWQCRSGTDEFVMMSRTVRSPANTYDHSARMFLTARKFKAENGRDPTEAELEELTGLNPDKQKLITQLTKPGSATSLDAPVSEDGMTSRLSFMVADEPSVLDGLIGEADREEILEAVESLNEREKEVIVRRFGLDGEEPETLKELGVRFGVVRERVRQIEVKAMDHIKMHFKKKLKRESA